jgi:hypothetical protein
MLGGSFRKVEDKITLFCFTSNVHFNSALGQKIMPRFSFVTVTIFQKHFVFSSVDMNFFMYYISRFLYKVTILLLNR